MPPLEIRNKNILTSQWSSSSFPIDDSVEKEKLTMIMERLEESVPMELVCGVRSLFDRATRVVVETEDDTTYQPIVKQAVSRSVQSILTDVVDQVSMLMELDENKRVVVEGLARAAVCRAGKNLDRLESLVNRPGEGGLEPFLNKLEGMDECTPVRVSMLSRPLALEFMAGHTETRSLPPAGQDDLPLGVDLTPYLYVTMDDMSEGNTLLEEFSTINVKIDHCSHRKYDAPSRSGFVGEAVVRAYVTPGKEAKISKQGTVWSHNMDPGRLGIVEVRALQKNAFPRIVQTRLDIYISSVYGSRGFVVTMKMNTFKSLDDQGPQMDIQLILQPPKNSHR